MKRAAYRSCRRPVIAAVVGAVSLVSGCRSLQTVDDPLRLSSGTVELRLTPPRTLDARRPDGSPASLAALTWARGRPSAVRGDSIVIHIESWRGESSSGEQHEEPWVAAAFATADSGVRILKRRFSTKRTLLTLAVAIGLVSLAIGQADVAY